MCQYRECCYFLPFLEYFGIYANIWVTCGAIIRIFCLDIIGNILESVPLEGVSLIPVIIGDILEVHATIESCFIIIRAVGNFLLCHLRAKVCHERLMFSMKDEYVCC